MTRGAPGHAAARAERPPQPSAKRRSKSDWPPWEFGAGSRAGQAKFCVRLRATMRWRLTNLDVAGRRETRFRLISLHERDGERHPAAIGSWPSCRCRKRSAPQARREAGKRGVAHAAGASTCRHRSQARSHRRARHRGRERPRHPRSAPHAGEARQRTRSIQPCGKTCASPYGA